MSVSFDKLTGLTLGKYRLEKFVGQSKIGPIFFVRDDTTTCLLRFLNRPANLTQKEHESFLEGFQYQASQIMLLQHPYIVPLLDYGVYRGVPYLISPHLAIRSLRTRIAKTGQLDISTVGRYLDQIATALEYAHEHAVLHGSLSVDCTFIQLDGRLVVADFGVRSLIELNQQGIPGGLINMWSGESAPEQLLAKPAGSTADVYTLGAVLYHLLSGVPVFSGSTPEEVIQQHLYSAVPPLTQMRSDLPAGMYSILARALAKDPAQRFHQPGALANAYHHLIAPNNHTRMPFVVSSEPVVQARQQATAAIPRADISPGEREWSFNGQSAASSTPPSSHSVYQGAVSSPHSLHGLSDGNLLDLSEGPRPTLMRRFRQRNARRVTLIAALVILTLLASSTLGAVLLTHRTATASSLVGQATFFSNQTGLEGLTDALRITVSGLQAPAAGSTYVAWLINNQTEEILPLGKLTEAQQSWTLAYTAGESNLLVTGNQLEITQAQGTVKAPTGKIILAGSFPSLAFTHIQHMLVSFPGAPGKIGLLVGLLEQVHLLDIQATLLQNAATNHNTVAVGCAAQSLIDILEGAHGSPYQTLTAACAQQDITATGDGFGLLGKNYLTGVADHATLAISQTDATSAMRQHEALLEVALTNITGWLATIEQDALLLRANPANQANIQTIVRLTDAAYHGVDANGDGQIDPVASEAGAITAYQQGQLMATMALTSHA